MKKTAVLGQSGFDNAFQNSAKHLVDLTFPLSAFTAYSYAFTASLIRPGKVLGYF